MCLRIAFPVLWITLLVAGCTTTGSSRSGAPVSSVGDRGVWHVVQRGETLYSIAWRYGLDYKTLAAANGISPPYTIYVDQKIRIAGESRRAARQKKKPRHEVSDGPPRRAERAAPSPPTAAQSVQGTGAVVWHWPLKGKVVERFSLSGTINKGVDIRGNAGDPVKAAADGVVVYAGGGLRGYGKLVIVKHNARFLSAYAHNRAILVKEGEKVKAGQTVARVGSTGPGADMLHFEIRRDGKPEDPLRYLPDIGH